MSTVPSASCEFCGERIPPEVMVRRRRDAKHHFCNRECQTAWFRQTGHYKQMSEAGKPARVEAVTKSNTEHPRKTRTLIHCSYCDKVIPALVLARRKPGQAHYFCGKECRDKWQKQSGYYSKISAKGKAARSRAVTESNRKTPRRKRKKPITT